MLVLASASPRRLELLRSAGIDPIVDASDIPEIADPALSPVANAARFARDKALAVAARRPADVILAADTIVTIDGKLLGKPADRDDARAMLKLLDGRGHYVVTCVHLLPPDGAQWPATSLTVHTAVALRPFAEGELDAYLDAGEWEGKAGAYAIQGRAASFVRAVLGSYTNVVGLPLCEVIEELRARGVVR